MGCQDQVAIWAVGRLAWLGVEGLRGCCATVAAWSAHWPISVYIVMYIDILLPDSSITALRCYGVNSELGLLDKEGGGADERQDQFGIDQGGQFRISVKTAVGPSASSSRFSSAIT